MSEEVEALNRVRLTLLLFGIDAAAYFGPQFGHGIVECPAAGGIVRDDKAVASIDADCKAGMPARVSPCMSQEFLALTRADSITKPGRLRKMRLSLEHDGNCLWFQYSTTGWFIAGTWDCRGHETGEIGHSTNLAANGLSSQLPV